MLLSNRSLVGIWSDVSLVEIWLKLFEDIVVFVYLFLMYVGPDTKCYVTCRVTNYHWCYFLFLIGVWDSLQNGWMDV